MVNRRNYRLAQEYLTYQSEVAQLDPRSVERYWFYLKYLLLWADEVSFHAIVPHRPTFASYLTTTRHDHALSALSSATSKKIVQTVRRFMTWLKMTYPHEFREVSVAWIESLRPPRSVESTTEHEFVTLEEMLRLCALQLDEDDLALRRDQAAAALLFLSGMRATAFGTLPIAAVDLPGRTIKQWPALGVATKNGKSATTYLLDIPELLRVVETWDAIVRAQLPSTAMWYAPIVSRWGEQVLSADSPGANRGQAVAKRMRHLFDMADLPAHSPHKFRHGHAVYALQHARTMADYKAVSMNLMHEDIRVTDSIYAPLASNEVQERIAALNLSSAAPLAVDRDLATFIGSLTKSQLSAALMAIAQQMTK